jgi:hypothetical protein
LDHVRGIFGIRPSDEMRWVDTRRVVAGVANEIDRRQRAVLEDERDAVRVLGTMVAMGARTEREGSVASLVAEGRPEPAGIGSARAIYLAPETVL